MLSTGSGSMAVVTTVEVSARLGTMGAAGAINQAALSGQTVQMAAANAGGNAPNNASLRPEKIYTGSKKHGIKWTEGPATAKSLGKPQGQWSQADLDYAGQMASTLKPGEGATFALPEGSTSVVHLPDGSTVPATHIWVRNNGAGTFYGYPSLGD